jgi:hypothetical protein
MAAPLFTGAGVLALSTVLAGALLVVSSVAAGFGFGFAGVDLVVFDAVAFRDFDFFPLAFAASATGVIASRASAHAETTTRVKASPQGMAKRWCKTAMMQPGLTRICTGRMGHPPVAFRWKLGARAYNCFNEGRRYWFCTS